VRGPISYPSELNGGLGLHSVFPLRRNVLFPKKHLDERSRRIKRGELIDMQKQPFRQFNQIVGNDCLIYISRAAYQECVELPGEKRGKSIIPANGRWGILYLSFATEFQNRSDDAHEGNFDMNVLMPNGFKVPRTVKVVLDHDFHGKNAFVFMLPEEQWPPA
jgi:hypothetical protein